MVRRRCGRRPVLDVRTDGTIDLVAQIEQSTRQRTVAWPYRDERDWWRIRTLLVDTHPRVAAAWNWDIRRWDGHRFHREEPCSDEEMAATIGLWETPDGRLVAAVHPESSGDAFLELDPGFRFLEPAMVGWAEEHLAGGPDEHGRRRLELWVLDDDTARIRLLQELGYEQEASGAWLRWLRFESTDVSGVSGAPGPMLVSDASGVPSVPEPYLVRTTDSTDRDCARMADLLNLAFGRTVHTAREYRTFSDRSPSFEHALNLVAVGPGGSFAAHVGVTFDALNRHGIVEPVCTHPERRRAGLARVLLFEGLRRLQARGALTAQVDTGERVPANALYAACGFTEAHHMHGWSREF